ncbi:MAG: 2Fe-2S iron-sulfur cluster-binding protein [Halieaceae bacterium]
MPQITYIEFDGTEHTVTADNGISLMQVAVDNEVPGIDADCGGGCACATCHVFNEGDWREKTGEAETMETSMLQLAEGVTEDSRLSCQITVDDSLDGLTVRMPESQH